MEKFVKVAASEVKKFESAKVQSFGFTVVDSSITGVTLQTDMGPIQFIYRDYSVSVLVPAMEKKWRATIVDSRGQFPDGVKDFESEHERNTWVSYTFDNADDRFTIALSEFEQPAS